MMKRWKTYNRMFSIFFKEYSSLLTILKKKTDHEVIVS